MALIEHGGTHVVMCLDMAVSPRAIKVGTRSDTHMEVCRGPRRDIHPLQGTLLGEKR